MKDWPIEDCFGPALFVVGAYYIGALDLLIGAVLGVVLGIGCYVVAYFLTVYDKGSS